MAERGNRKSNKEKQAKQWKTLNVHIHAAKALEP
jgi:hypothetical protein